MVTPGPDGICLMVRSRPYEHRAARADLDLALAAAALDFRLDVYFLGSALMQLAAGRETAPAMLPAGYRSWAALPDLAEVRLHAQREWLDRCERRGIRLLLPVEAMSAEQMKQKWRRCRHALVI